MILIRNNRCKPFDRMGTARVSVIRLIILMAFVAWIPILAHKINAAFLRLRVIRFAVLTRLRLN